MQQLQDVSEQLFVDHSASIDRARTLWQQICADPLFVHKIRSVTTQWPLPEWQGQLDHAIQVTQGLKDYRVYSVDGSQIYPDKHQGTNCFLINTGLVDMVYGTPINGQPPVQLSNQPYLFTDGDAQDMFAMSTELVNCRRQEYELRAALEYAREIKKSGYGGPQVGLFDGSLIFWHLDSKDLQLKHTFLSCYLMLLHQFYDLKMPVAGYISLPKSKEIVNIIRVAAESGLVAAHGAQPLECDYLVDATVAHFFLSPATRTIVFKNITSISAQYPDHLRPHFFYLHVGDEIGRVEIPAWIAQDEKLVDMIAAILLDQSIKGRGYPVALAEAHEQAVIKGPDREFFYHLIYKLGFEHKQRFLLSQKSIKKRGIGI